MHRIFMGLVVGLVVSWCAAGAARAQNLEPVPDEIAKEVVESALKDLENVKDAQLKVEVDAEKSIVVGGAEIGGVVFLPHKGVSEEALKKSDKEVMPLGVLGLYLFKPVVDKKPVPKEKLRMGNVVAVGQNFEVAFFYLGIKSAVFSEEKQ